MTVRRELVLFVALAIVLSWLAWVPLAAHALGYVEARPSQYLHFLGSLGPALAAVIVSALQGRAVLARLLRRCLRAPVRWIAIAVLAPVTLYLLAALALRLFGVSVDLSATGASTEFPALGIGLYAVASIVMYGFGEELGWRGFLLTRLQRMHSAIRASLIVAPIWVVWHLPLFAFSAGMSSMGPLEIVGWASSMLAGVFLMTMLFNASRGSVLVVALFHGALDILISSPTGGPLQATMGALVTIAGLTIPFRFGLRHLAPHPRATEP